MRRESVTRVRIKRGRVKRESEEGDESGFEPLPKRPCSKRSGAS